MSTITLAPTKESILEHIKNKDYNWFDFNIDDCTLNIGSYSVVEERNMGDGNEMYRTLFFSEYELYVSLTGWFSSYGPPEWTDIFVSEPFTYYETRYSPIQK